jgi:hypothetical protein
MLGIAHNGDAKFLLCAILSEYREYESTDLTLCRADINYRAMEEAILTIRLLVWCVS